ncbi:MAG: hypothetical protein Barrevirus19_16 [Barrevirus sp.]|uniref:Uncharacterized protein n=1 Tax=Barrevirus sp. TaxID=2487763 RepID=A0A3G4ZT82_9VIRU|nr:MAG: hypothetical protein Barrevirus19_16 [Barrevirus sp.]
MNYQDQLDKLFNEVSSSQADLIQKQNEAMNRKTDSQGNDFDLEYGVLMKRAMDQIAKHKTQQLICFSIGGFTIGIVPDSKNVVAAVIRDLIKKFGNTATIYLIVEKHHGAEDVDMSYIRLTINSQIPPTGQFAIQFNNVVKKILPNDSGLVDFRVVRPFMD